MEKKFVFREGYKGFYDWLASINRIKLDMATINSKEIGKKSALHFWDNTKKAYVKFLKIMSRYNEYEKAFVKYHMSHHIPPFELRMEVNFDHMYKIWHKIMFVDKTTTITEITKEEVGIKLKEAREYQCRSREQVAEMIGISANTLKSYETGKRMPPFNVVFKIAQFMDLDLHF